MSKKVSILLLVGLTLLLIFAVFGGQALANEGWGRSTASFSAAYTTYPQVVGGGNDGYDFIILDIPGEGEGTHLGASTWFADDMKAYVDGPLPFPQYSQMIFKAANGDELYGHFAGFGYPNAAGGFYYWGGFDINGGTGRFEGALGNGIYHGSAGGGSGRVTFEGELLLP